VLSAIGRPTAWALAATTAAAGLLAFTASPAAASVSGYYQQSATTVSNSVAKTARAECDNGWELMDAGAATTGASGDVVLDDVFADQSLDYATATGMELGGTATNWSVTSHITCALPSPGQEWVWEESAYDTLPYKSVRAECPGTKTVLGNGYTIRGGGGDVHVYAAEPDGGATTAATEVTVSAANAAGTARNWSVNAFLICADPLPGQRVVAVTSASNTGSKGVLASCGLIGTVLATGSTVAVDGPVGEIVVKDDYVSTEYTGWSYATNATGTATPWTITTYAFCVDA
jgi:hypothetical protein